MKQCDVSCNFKSNGANIYALLLKTDDTFSSASPYF